MCFDEKQVISRIIELRTAFAGPRGKNIFANELGISPSTYNYYEKDRLPPVGILLKICRVTGADLNWLLTGCQSSTCTVAVDESLLTKTRDLVSKYPDLRAGLNAFMDIYVQSMKTGKAALDKAKAGESEKKAQIAAVNANWIPILGRTAAGIVHFWGDTTLPQGKAAITELDELVKKYTGKEIVSTMPGLIELDLQARSYIKDMTNLHTGLIHVARQDASGPMQFIDCGELKSRFPDCFALQIDGDSMEPRIKDGDCVVVSPSISASQGQIAIIKLDGQIGVTCKLVRLEEDNIHLIPMNEHYETRIVPRQKLLWAVAVLCHINV